MNPNHEAPKLELALFQPPVWGELEETWNLVFPFWQKGWEQVFQEIHGRPPEASDNLTRQHEVLVLMKEGQPVSMVCHRWVNFRDPATYADSYFQTGWNPNTLALLKDKTRSLEGLGLIGSQIFVAPDLRGQWNGISLKLLISYLSFQRVQDLGAEFTLGTIRTDRGMDKVFASCGAITLAQGGTYHDAKVDLVYFSPKEKPILIPEAHRFSVQQLLRNAVSNIENLKTPLRRTA